MTTLEEIRPGQTWRLKRNHSQTFYVEDVWPWKSGQGNADVIGLLSPGGQQAIWNQAFIDRFELVAERGNARSDE